MAIRHEDLTGTYEQKRAAVAQMNLMDDIFCSVVLENKDACEYLVSALLGKRITVIENKTQYAIRNIENHSIVLDALVEDEEHNIYNVEIDNGGGADYEHRIRYYTAMIDCSFLAKSKSYNKLPDLYMLFISKNDFLGDEQNNYEVEKTVGKNKIPYRDGIHIYLFNTSVNNRSNLSELLKYLADSDPDDTRFGALSQTVNFYKVKNEGVEYMCKIVDDYAKEYAAGQREAGKLEGIREGKLETVKSMLADGFSLDKALKYAGLDTQTYEKYVQKQ